MIPPILARIRIKNREGRGVNLWLPVFIFWIIALPFVLLALIILSIGSIFMHPDTRRRVWRILGSIYTILCELRKAEVDIDSMESDVLIRFI